MLFILGKLLRGQISKDCASRGGFLEKFWKSSLIFSNYWMRLSRIWRILQVEESVIHPGRRPRWITPSEISRILHILRKPGSIIFDVNDSIICTGLYFWRHFDVNGSITCSGLHFWRHWFNMTEFLVNRSCLWWIMRVVNGEIFRMNNNSIYTILFKYGTGKFRGAF